ncbi:MAG: hypothetical protein IKC36_00610 [Clostridia bacterium]|nr:hypothetical protein [Clostridia bacterium]
MNKLDGFYQLKTLTLPTVDWVEYKGQSLDRDILWTVRSAVFSGDDFNLPRAVGVSADEAERFAAARRELLGGEGIVVVYPFFVADKSGTVTVSSEKTEIECVLGDLWNLVTHGRSDYSAVFNGENRVNQYGNPTAMTDSEIKYILECGEKLRRFFRSEIAEGKTVYAEWSFAYNCAVNGSKTGERYAVFYELRTI